MRGKVNQRHGGTFCAAAFAAAITLGGIGVARGAPLYSDGFEGYVGGGQPLDKNFASGPNAAPNGSGNPWFGPAPPNARVVGTEGGVVPHSGNQMIRGSQANDLDENWYNLAYRLNGGQPYKGNVSFDFWFYDPNGNGASASDYRDFGALGFYNTAPSGTDYPTGGSLNSSSLIQRLAIGASSDINGAYDSTLYQVRIVGAAGGYDPGSGWFNTPIPRSIGWHHGTVNVGPALGDQTNQVNFLIDGLPAFAGNSTTNYGYNVLELNTNYGPTNGYIDDVAFTVIPEPAGLAIFAIASGLLLRARRQT